jgi:hypothetical protein
MTRSSRIEQAARALVEYANAPLMDGAVGTMAKLAELIRAVDAALAEEQGGAIKVNVTEKEEDDAVYEIGRAVGFRAGIEAAATKCEEHARYLRILARTSTIDPAGKEADARVAGFCAALIRTLSAPPKEEPAPCPRCDGTGIEPEHPHPPSNKCGLCGGTGLAPTKEGT